jgi:Tfp pilus assembly protein PilF
MASWQHAQQYLRHRRHAPALASYRKLVVQFPAVPQLWAELGTAAAGELDFPLAGQAFARAVDLAPAEAAFFIAVSQKYYQLRRPDQALACLKRAVQVEPSSIQARLRLASFLERTRQVEEARECIQAGLAQHPNDPRLRYFSAFLLHRNGLYGEAEAALRDLLKAQPLPVAVQADVHHLLGVVLDASEQYAEAMRCLDKAKQLRCQTVNTATMERLFETADQSRRKILAELTPEMLRRWREESSASPCKHPLALIGGAPRSGTTLLEQILGTHPQILAFDESLMSLKELVDPLDPPPPAQRLTLKTLNRLEAKARAVTIRRYFKTLLRETEENPAGRLLLDKTPSATPHLHIWLRLFPQSKLIIALRDPRDVVISCYFMHILEDWGIVCYGSLEKTAKFYASSMDVWLRMRELGGFDWMETRYEDLVANLEKEGRRATSFLGLPWHEAQATYYESARRKYVHSPTYNDVTKPVYSTSMGRWKHYAGALEPIQEMLAKYCKAFGYG